MWSPGRSSRTVSLSGMRTGAETVAWRDFFSPVVGAGRADPWLTSRAVSPSTPPRAGAAASAAAATASPAASARCLPCSVRRNGNRPRPARTGANCGTAQAGWSGGEVRVITYTASRRNRGCPHGLRHGHRCCFSNSYSAGFLKTPHRPVDFCGQLVSCGKVVRSWGVLTPRALRIRWPPEEDGGHRRTRQPRSAGRQSAPRTRGGAAGRPRGGTRPGPSLVPALPHHSANHRGNHASWRRCRSRKTRGRRMVRASSDVR